MEKEEKIDELNELVKEEEEELQQNKGNKKKDYEIIEVLGKGAYGIVYLAKNNRDGELVAIKKILKNDVEQGVPMTALREISLLKELNHVNIVKLKEVNITVKNLKMVFEYVPKDMSKVIKTVNNGQGLGKDLTKVSFLLNLIVRN